MVAASEVLVERPTNETVMINSFILFLHIEDKKEVNKKRKRKLQHSTT